MQQWKLTLNTLFKVSHVYYKGGEYRLFKSTFRLAPNSEPLILSATATGSLVLSQVMWMMLMHMCFIHSRREIRVNSFEFRQWIGFLKHHFYVRLAGVTLCYLGCDFFCHITYLLFLLPDFILPWHIEQSTRETALFSYLLKVILFPTLVFENKYDPKCCPSPRRGRRVRS